MEQRVCSDPGSSPRQCAVKLVSPAVVWAYQQFMPAFVFQARAGTAMAAQVKQCLERILVRTDDDDGLVGQFVQEVIAGFSLTVTV